MITERGRVVAVEEGALWLETVRRSTCSGCSARSGCGHGLLNSLSGTRRHLVRVLPGPFDVDSFSVDEELEIGIPENALLIGALQVYGLPLVLLLAGAALGAHYGGDAMAALGALAGFSLALVALRLHSRRLETSSRYQPVVTARFGPGPLAHA